MNSKQLIDQDLIWIAEVKENNSSAALKHLFVKYRPLVEKYGRLYNIPLFEPEDWYQEAWLVCYQTCLIFDGHQGSKFGSFFKLRLQYRAANLLREQLAVKRQTNLKATSLEQLRERDPEFNCCLRQNVSANDSNVILFDYQYYLHSLSALELCALKIWLGIKPVKSEKYSAQALLRATQRARSKLRQLTNS